MTAVLHPRAMPLHLDGTMGRLGCESLLFEVEVRLACCRMGGSLGQAVPDVQQCVDVV